VKPIVAAIVAWVWIASFSTSAKLIAQTSMPDSSLRVEYGGPIHKELAPGQTLTLRPSLRNISSRPVAIAHGTRFLVLDAQFVPPRPPLGFLQNYKFPDGNTWGEVKHLEYPNPFAVYTMPLYERTLAPTEDYAPAVLYQKSEYVVPFDSVGTYKIRVCAHITEKVICGARDIIVTVK
jgi:hypothetical protein